MDSLFCFCYLLKQLIRMVGGFDHLEKYESQWEELSHILWKIKNVSNHHFFLYLFARHAGLDIEASALSVRERAIGPTLWLVPVKGPVP